MKLHSSALIICALFPLAYEPLCQGQVATGPQPFGSFSSSTFDTINLGNLNEHFEIPIIAKAGRGLPFTYSLTFDSSIWSPVSANGAVGWSPNPNFGWSAVGTAVNAPVTGYVSYAYVPLSCTDNQTPPKRKIGPFLPICSTMTL